MAVRITKDLGNIKKFIPDIKQAFKKNVRVPLQFAVLKDILRGISPVKGERFQKYSKSYKDQIRGKVGFITITTKLGQRKVIAIQALKNGVTPSVPFLANKPISPVNMKLTGAMLRGFRVKIITANDKGIVQLSFDDPHNVAAYHNDLGAGKSKVKRRLLPTNQGEEFNYSISQLIKSVLRATISEVINKFK